VAEPTPTEDEIASVLRRYVHDGRLTAMPRAGRRRLIVLEQIVQRFEPGRRYSEEKVNTMLRVVLPDHAALRRYLVDAGLLARSSGEYWRIGGRVDVE
jgi:hypothetical protein